jgi:hypothetical protein
VVAMEEVSSGEGDGPEGNDERTDSEDPVTRVAILGCEGGGFTGAEDLAADADGHQKSAEDEGGPSHSFLFVPQPR